MKRVLLPLLALVALAVCASPAAAYWKATGSGTGSATVDTLLGGPQPTASVSGQTVTVQWAQNAFQGSPLGTYSGGGYTIKRYPAAGGTAVTPNATCDTTISGATATLSCQEATTPLGSWQYTVTPVLKTWTGAESAKSSTAAVVPTLSSVTAQNPAVGQTTGGVQISWATATGATGYNLYRRTSAGSYNYASPVNGATPLTGTSYTDPGSGLVSGTTYDYVVRGIQGTESPSSNELAAAVISRPSAPASTTATPASAAKITIGWAAVSGAAGYNIYRRTSAGSYNYATPLNGATPASGTSYSDTTSVNGTTYRYVVRAVITGAGSAQVESADSPESAAATADSTPPPVPTALTVGAGAGPQLPAAQCAFAVNTRFVNNAGKASVPLTVTIAAPETGENVVFSAQTTGAAVTKTVSATGTTVTTNMDLSSLGDGTVTLTAVTADSLGNQSATRAPTNAIVKDTVSQLGSLVYSDLNTTTQDTVAGTAECGTVLTGTETVGPNPGVSASFTVTAANGTFSGVQLDAVDGSTGAKPYGYTISGADLAGNASATINLTGSDTK
jgi:hypothetical protein